MTPTKPAFAYGISPIQDQLTKHYRSTADYFRDLHPLSDNTAIDLIRSDELDVLIDLTGLTTFSRPAIACARPAAMVLNYSVFQVAKATTTSMASSPTTT